MDQVHDITSKKDPKTADPIAFIKQKARQVRDSRAAKPVLTLAAITLGAYLGARQPMRKIKNDVHDIADRAKRLDHNFYTYANESLARGRDYDDRQQSMRNAISEATARGEGFRHYPGLGVLFIDENGHPESRDYGSGTPAPIK